MEAHPCAAGTQILALCPVRRTLLWSAPALYALQRRRRESAPSGCATNLETNRYQGDLYGIGLAYGYQWILSPHWNFEAAVGVGYGFTHYKYYECRTCGNYKGTEDKHLFMPTKLALSFIYIIK